MENKYLQGRIWCLVNSSLYSRQSAIMIWNITRCWTWPQKCFNIVNNTIKSNLNLSPIEDIALIGVSTLTFGGATTVTLFHSPFWAPQCSLFVLCLLVVRLVCLSSIWLDFMYETTSGENVFSSLIPSALVHQTAEAVLVIKPSKSKCFPS